jgi:hypothetical protein
MKKIALLLVLLIVITRSTAQTYINNQVSLQPSSNFYISGTAQSNTLKTTAGTNATGLAHFHMFNGDGNTPANLRWTQAFIGLEGASNVGSDFRLFRYSNTGTFLGFGLAIERATGNMVVNNLTFANSSKVQGTGTSTNQSYLQFMQSDNITREGYVGIGDNTNKDVYLVSDNGNVNLVPKAGGGVLQISSNQVQNTTGTFLMSNALSNNISINAVGLGAPSFTTRSIGSKIILWNAPVNATTAGWDIGIETSHMWFGIPAASNLQGFKFYAGTTQIGRLDGLGGIDLAGQGRFKGWYTANGTGIAAELGISTGRALLIGYDRTPGATKYIPLLLAGGSTSSDQTTLLINEKGVGIGTMDPQSKLAVNGLITAKQIKVTQTGWADYVFHKNYQLPTLVDVEKYVAANQHLEGIPSAAEVEKDGIDVGEMNKKLLAKVEELTLYLIEQNKKIAALEEWKMQQEKTKK